MGYTKREIEISVLECRVCEGPDPHHSTSEQGSHQGSNSCSSFDDAATEASTFSTVDSDGDRLLHQTGEAPPAVPTTAVGSGGWFGGGSKLSKMFKSPVNMMVAPVTTVARGMVATTEATLHATSSVARGVVATTEAVVTGKIAENMVGRSDLWCVVSFGSHSSTSQIVQEAYASEPPPSFDVSISWPVKAGGKGPVTIELWRRKKLSVRKSEEMVGRVSVSWSELEQSASTSTPIESSFPVGPRHKLRARVRMVESPIDGADEPPLLDPRDDLHQLYATVFRSPPPLCYCARLDATSPAPMLLRPSLCSTDFQSPPLLRICLPVIPAPPLPASSLTI